MNSLLTINDPTHVVKEEIDICETVIQEQRLEGALEEDTGDANVTSGSCRTIQPKHDSTPHDEAKARKLAMLFQCPKCIMRFDNRKLAQSHMRKIHSSVQRRPESCPICSRTFKYRSVLFVHMNNHREKVCPICNVFVSGSEALKYHVESLHIGKLEFVCPRCFKVSIDSASHEDHIDSHNGRRRYECVDCSKYYASPEGLERHRLTHAGIIKSKLDRSSNLYKPRQNLHVHMNRQALQEHRKTHLSLPRKIIERKYKCSYCRKSYSRRESLRSHVHTHTGARPFKCNECPKDYTSAPALSSHRRSHLPGSSQVKCSVCCKNFKDSRYLQYHMNTHTGTRPFKCNACPKDYTSPQGLTKHRRSHLPGSSQKCPVCSKNFKDSRYLQYHMNRHTGTGLFKCNECSKDYTSRQGLSYHRRSHLPGSSQVKCSVCSKKFKNSRNLQYHMNRHTGTRPFKCYECPKDYSSPQALSEHLRSHLPGPSQVKRQSRLPGSRQAKCSICFKNCTNLRDHMNTHTGARPFKCDHCPQSFADPSTLRKHRLKHLSEGNRVKCSVCSKTLSCSQSLRCHMNIHTDTRSFQCDQCPKSFISRSGLNYHRSGHLLGASLLKCSICSKTLKSSEGLRLHMNIHTSTRPYKCDRCPKSFHSPRSLAKHRQRHSQSDKFEYKCYVCSKGFTLQRSLNLHFRRNHDASYKCHQCGETYGTRQQLGQHYRRNPSHCINELKCSICSKGFLFKRSINSHMKTHLESELHEEGKDGELDKDADLHTALAKYKCKECGKEFISERNLSFHSRQHEKELTA